MGNLLNVYYLERLLHRVFCAGPLTYRTSLEVRGKRNISGNLFVDPQLILEEPEKACHL